MGTRVNPTALLRAAAVTDGFAEAVRRDAANIEADADNARLALPGFQTRTALELLYFGWTDALACHRVYLEHLGEALTEAAHGYYRSDAENAASFAELKRF